MTCSLSLIFLPKTEGFTKFQDFLRCLNKHSFELLSWCERDLGKTAGSIHDWEEKSCFSPPGGHFRKEGSLFIR